MPKRTPEATRTAHHAVQFYGEEVELFTTIGTFLSEGLIAGQPAIVIATTAHRTAIADRLASLPIDVARARHLGDLVMVDAEETLGTLMNDGVPDPRLFQRTIGHLIEQTLRGRAHTPVRAYGEMVDLLWRRGHTDAAIRLEALWSQQAAARAFSLLCGYAIGTFQKETSKVDEICRQHTHVIGADLIPPAAAYPARA